jgi:hypothetical protein
MAASCPHCDGVFITGSGFSRQVQCPHCHKNVFVKGDKDQVGRVIAGVVLAILFIGLLVVASEPSQQRLEAARARGYEAGNTEGQRLGESEGFTNAARAAEREAYDATIGKLYAEGDYHRTPIADILLVSLAFAVGFILQWLVFYVFRRIRLLHDIDWLALPEHATTVDITKIASSCLLGILLLAGGCSSEQKAWQQGYDSAYQAASHAGMSIRSPRAEEQGRNKGVADAKRDAETGNLPMRFYQTAIFVAVLFGALAGVLIQYLSILQCNWSGRVVQLWVVAFVPGMKQSLCYAIFERQRELLLGLDAELAKLQATKEIQCAKIQAVHDTIEKKIRAASSLDELRIERVLGLAEQEFARIAPAAPTSKLFCYCPRCRGKVGYGTRKAGRLIKCPHSGCGQPIMLPPVEMGHQ